MGVLDHFLPYIPIVIGGIITLTGYWVTSTLRPRGSRELAFLQELQEELKTEREKREVLEKKVEDIQAKLYQFQVRDALWEIHATRVEAQVLDLGAKPVDRPQELSPFRRLLKTGEA